MLSIIIPTVGRSASLARLLEALGSQTLRQTETIIVDQNPPGVLEATMPEYLLNTARHIQLAEPNVSLARNVGFAHSSGSLLLFLDDDMVPGPEFCATGTAILTEHTEVQCLCALVYTSSRELSAIRAVNHADVNWFSARFSLPQPGVPSWYVKRNMTGRCIPGRELYEIKDCPSGATFFTSSYFADSGGFDEILFHYAGTAEDQELFWRMRSRGMRMWFARDLLVYHDHNVPGGCNLRTDDYWSTRERCAKAWAYRHRIHDKADGRISVIGMWSLMRSSFLNSRLLKSSLRDTLREIALLRRAVRSSRKYLESCAGYVSKQPVNHLSALTSDRGQRW